MADTQTDPVSQWKAFSPDQRDEALGKMSPDQKLHLKGLLEGSQKTDTSDANTTDTDEPGLIQKAQARFDQMTAPSAKPTSSLSGPGGIVDEFGKGTAQFLSPAVHPLAAIKSTAQALMAGAHIGSTGNPKIDAQNEEAQQGQREELGQQGKELGKDPAYLAGSVIGSALVTHGLLKGLPETPVGKSAIKSVGELKKSVGDTLHGAAQSKFANDVPKKAIGKFAEQTEAVNDQARVTAERGQHQQAIEDHSKVLDQKYQKAEAGAKSANDAQWSEVRKKTGDTGAPMEPLQAAASKAAELADPNTSSLFKRIIRGDKASESVVVDGKPVSLGDPQYAKFYEMQYGEPPAFDGAGEAKFDQLQRWRNWAQDKMYSGNLTQGDYQAYKVMTKALDDSMQDIAKRTGATEDLKAARQSHTQMKETFSDSPNQPQTAASKSLQEESPEYQKQKSREGRLEKVAKYDPTVKDTAKTINNHRQALDNLPAKAPKLQPEAPDITAKTKEEMAANIKKYGATGQWVWRLIAGGAMKGLLHGSGAGAFAGDLLIGQAALRLFTGALRSDSILNWLASPTADTLRRINELPPADAQRLKMAMSALSKQELAQHPERAGISINPDMARWLSTAQAAPKNRKEALDRKP